ncbi:glycosyltransferase [Eilatimonas milleporae]|nr:glycosyltransferase [Eilatimonas milleporae]
MKSITEDYNTVKCETFRQPVFSEVIRTEKNCFQIGNNSKLQFFPNDDIDFEKTPFNAKIEQKASIGFLETETTLNGQSVIQMGLVSPSHDEVVLGLQFLIYSEGTSPLQMDIIVVPKENVGHPRYSNAIRQRASVLKSRWCEVTTLIGFAQLSKNASLLLDLVLPASGIQIVSQITYTWFATTAGTGQIETKSKATILKPLGAVEVRVSDIGALCHMSPIFLNNLTISKAQASGHYLCGRSDQTLNIRLEPSKKVHVVEPQLINLGYGFHVPAGYTLSEAMLDQVKSGETANVFIGDTLVSWIAQFRATEQDNLIARWPGPQERSFTWKDSAARSLYRDVSLALFDADYFRLQMARVGIFLNDPVSDGLSMMDAVTDLSVRPCPLFDPQKIAKDLSIERENLTVGDVVRTYLTDPRARSIQPSALFCPSEQLVAYANSLGEPTLIAYLSRQECWTMEPHPLFDPTYYRLSTSHGPMATEAPYVTYLKSSFMDVPHPNPCAIFDTAYYRAQFDDLDSTGLHPLEYFIAYGCGSPHPNFLRSVFLAEHPNYIFDQNICAQMLQEHKKRPDKLYSAGVLAPENVNEAPKILVQMTPKNARNPYYRDIKRGFPDDKWDYRFSSSLEEMLNYSSKKKGIIFWFHQFEPFYHAKTTEQTWLRKNELLKALQGLKSNGATLVHTWHNPYPYNPEHLDVDIELYAELDGILDLVFTHSSIAPKWIRRFIKQGRIDVVPHHSVAFAFQTNMSGGYARRRLKLESSDFVFLTFGEFKPYKSLNILSNAWAQFMAHEDQNSSKLMLLGKWSGSFTARSGFTYHKNVILKNQSFSDYDLSMAVTAADVCVFTHETVWVSGAVMTALAFGKPVIVPSGTGLCDYIEDGFNGLVYQNGDSQSLAQTILRSQDVDLRKRISAQNKILDDGLEITKIALAYRSSIQQVSNKKMFG